MRIFFIAIFLGSCARAVLPLVLADNARVGTEIDNLEQLTIGDVPQWIFSRGPSNSNVVLLFVHGGPGSTLMPFSRAFDEFLVSENIVVHWDQRHAGKSFESLANTDGLSVLRYVRDCVELAQYLREKYPDKNLVLVGHSWGSIIGLLAASTNPELFAGYVGVGQVVDFEAAGQWAHKKTLDFAQSAADQETVEALNAIGVPPFRNAADFMRLSSLVSKSGGVFNTFNPEKLSGIARHSAEYIERDWQFQQRAMGESIAALMDEIQSFSAISVSQISMPVMFVNGEHDWVSPLAVLRPYVESLETPNKKLMVFPESGHFPFWEEPEKFADAIGDFLAEVGLLR